MPVTRDNAMWGGREIYGFPKKLAETIQVTRKGKTVTGTCIRRGTPETGTGTLTLAPSKLDPLHEIPIQEVLMAGYVTGMQIWIAARTTTFARLKAPHHPSSTGSS
jgi:acetoacetate decarboxylase